MAASLSGDLTVTAWRRAGGDGLTAIAAGEYHSLALKTDGSIVGWGLDSNGQATPPSDQVSWPSPQEDITVLASVQAQT